MSQPQPEIEELMDVDAAVRDILGRRAERIFCEHDGRPLNCRKCILITATLQELRRDTRRAIDELKLAPGSLASAARTPRP